MKKGFTLIELVVAVALLSVVLSFAGVIFNVSIDSQRMARANAEIVRKLRAITDQLNTDFAGIQTDAPLLIWFEKDDPNRYDQIMFFANGDFQSIQLYTDSSGNAIPDPDGEWVLEGNVARIHYGQAQIWTAGTGRYPEDMDEQDRMLARRQHILTADPCVKEWPDEDDVDGSFSGDSGRYRNEVYEHDSLPLVRWKLIDGNVYRNAVIDTCFDYRPLIDMADPNTFHKLMCEGVGSFAIQWAYWDDTEDRSLWFPSDDPDGDSHFGTGKMPYKFGVYFNIPGSIGRSYWYSIEEAENKAGEDFSAFPKALKFTFRLYDSKGLIEQDGEKGREFTHIVYLGG